MNKLMKFGRFSRVIDEQGQLSITNIAIMVVLVKLTLAPTASFTEAGTLLIALANYSYKRHIQEKKRFKVV